jgi:hypothetical protein
MAHLLLQPRSISIEGDGAIWVPSIHGEERADGIWEGWIEFRSIDGTETRTTDRETTQPNSHALEYWASGLEPVYYEGAFARAAPLLA